MIECKDLIKIYSDQYTNFRVAALRGIDLRIKKGELISIIGPSGSGKSTFIKVLAGIEEISSGEARVGSYQLGSMTAKDLLSYRLNSIGLVHQFPERTLFLNGTVKDNLKFASSLCSMNRQVALKQNREILEHLNILDLENRRVSYLSGGEMIRTAIACMLAKNAHLLLCDEPTGQLDTENTERVKSLLKQISRDFGTTILVVTHDLRFISGVDRTCEIHSGRVSSLFNTEDNFAYEKQEFPLLFSSQIDSSQSVRIPTEVYRLMQLKDNVNFSVSEDYKVEIVNPNGLVPQKIEIKEARKQKTLSVKSLPKDYYKTKEIEIKLVEVSKIYSTKTTQVHALTEITAEFYKGELAFVVGPSGSGKTTLIKLITGMESSTSGEIFVLDHELHMITDAECAKFRRNNIGIVSQQGNLHPYITIKENLFIRDILSNKNIVLSKYPQDAVESIFDMYHIEQRKNSYPLEISGGELQRASLAIAQFGKPGLLILDEPTANMDSELANEIMDQLYKIHEQFKTTMLISTHDINLVKDGTRVIELKDGKVDNDGLGYLVDL
ncbi:MAG: ATP-binding cassette domain-containing protein [Candidatus Heimdallarchaeota archaeon]